MQPRNMPLLLAFLLVMNSPGWCEEASGIISREFIFDSAPFPECHASTIAQIPGGLIAAWFGGTREKADDVTIWCSRQVDGKWTAPASVADGVQSDGKRAPCWNPVLFQPRGGNLLLFYKVGPSPSQWWGMVRQSADAGKTWGNAQRLTDGILGPIKDKPVQLDDGTILCGSSTEDQGWRVHFERSADGGKTWTKTDAVNDAMSISAIQPTILLHPNGRLQAIGRTRQKRIFQVWSEDGGKAWGAMTLTDLPNPNSGIDAVTLKDGRQLLVYNHDAQGERSPLNVAVSNDGKTWEAGPVLEDEPGMEFSYPAVIQTSDGLVHITYTWKRQRIRHVVLDPAKLQLKPLPTEQGR